MSHAFLLDVQNIGRSFGKFAAVSEVSLRVRRNTVHSVIGPNGAGKSTLFNVLTGSLAPTAGEILFDGKPVSRLSPYRRLDAGIARAFQISSIFREMTVRENIWIAIQGALARLRRLHGSFSAQDIERRCDQLLEEFGLEARADHLAGVMSHGQQRSLEFAMTMASDPELVFLDEPTAGVGADDINRFMELIRRIGKEKTVLLVEHNMKIVMQISDEITVLARGRVLASGDAASIRQNSDVKSAYLGERSHA